MRFHITRTTQWDDEVKPCPEAVQGERETHTYYTFRTIAEAQKRYPNFTFEKVDGRVRTTARTQKAWFVDINAVDDLVALCRKRGPLIITNAYDNHKQPEIEIYDGYRE